ncbi:hypothetical protein AB1A81_15210 [Bdellovibrio bacteriovorus]|nr:hypothetical protein [Bdellovibrio bacteriovorus]BEV69658.1 hypothetical protein Bb109J_c3078 [Bdellovibrio bacteriovorus]
MKILASVFLGLLLASPVFGYEDDIETDLNEVYVINVTDEATTLDRDYYYNFGRVGLFEERRATFFLRNNSGLPMYINDFDLSGPPAFDYAENCPQILFRGQQCRIRVFFQPRTVGLKRAELEIELTPQEDIVLNLRGRGVLRY